MKAIRALGVVTLVLVAGQLLGGQIRSTDAPKGGKGTGKAGGKAAANPLVGTYQIVGGEKNGQKIAPEKLKDNRVRFTDGAVAVLEGDKKEVYAATYRLDTSKKPWSIMMTTTLAPQAGQTTKGLVEHDGDTLKLIYALPGGKTPTEFTAGEGQMMFHLKRAAGK